MYDEPLKIGFVLDDSLDKTDGVQQYVLTLGEYLRGQGHEVHYLVGKTTRTDLPHIHSLSRNMNVRFNQNRMSMPLPADKVPIRRLLGDEQFDILHVQMPYSPFLAGRIIKLAPPRTAIVGTFHVAPHGQLVHLANSALRWLVSGSLKQFNEVMSVSTVAQDFAWQTYGVESSLVPNCADLSSFYAAKPLKKYDDPKKVATIVFLGRLVERKGCRQLLDALAYIKEHRMTKMSYRVVVCGTGPLEADLKRQAARDGLTSVVEFVGRISEADKPRYLAGADIAVFPSTGGESFGIVLLEAMAAARGAVLAGDNPGYAKLMAGRPQALFNPYDPEQLARKIVGLLENNMLRAEIHDWQRQYVAPYDVTTVADDVLSLYASALHKRRS
jgi:phosphatidyl-myo-inositol alpha-mannosyltransferase